MLMMSNQDSSLTSVNNHPKAVNDKALIIHNRNMGFRGNCHGLFARPKSEFQV